MFIKPEEILKYLDLHKDMVLVDLGAGTGFYSILAAKILPKGKVYSIDINKDFLTTINHKAHDLHLDNIRTVFADLEEFHGSHLNDNIADKVIVSNIFFHIQNKENFLNEINRILKPNGQILFVDFNPESFLLGKKQSHVLKKEEVISLFEKKNFILDKTIFTGEHHYAIIFNKQTKNI